MSTAQADLLPADAPGSEPAKREPPMTAPQKKLLAACNEHLEGLGHIASEVEHLLPSAFEATARGDCWIVLTGTPDTQSAVILTSRPRVIDAMARGRALFILDVAAIRRALLK